MKNRGRHSGQSLVEFALIFPLLIFLITGFLDLGRAIFYYSSLTNAVREATRYAIVHKDELQTAYDSPANNTLQDKVMEYAFGLSGTPDPLTREDIVVTVTKEGNLFLTPGDDLFWTVSIEASYTFKPVTPGMKELFGSNNGIDLTVQSTMYVSPGAR